MIITGAFLLMKLFGIGVLDPAWAWMWLAVF